MFEDFENLKFNGKTVFKVLIGLLVLFTLMASFTTNESGNFMRIQNNMTGSHQWKTNEGVVFKLPFMSTVTTYPEKVTVAFTADPTICDSASICKSPPTLSFNDTYTITPEVTLRFALSPVPTDLEEMHDSVKSPENLLGNTLTPFSMELLSHTAAQFRAEDFSQGGQNDFKKRIIDQATNGLLETVRRKVEINRETADSSANRSGSTKLSKQYRFEIEIKRDNDGNPLRMPVSIAEYNINIVNSGINLLSYQPDAKLAQFMNNKKDRIMQRAKIHEEQENERQEAITAQLKGERQLIEQTNKQRKDKESARIDAEKRVMEAEYKAQQEIIERRKVADLAIINKEKELQEAKANKEIQTALAEAAKYEAIAIKERGFAKVEVERMSLQAKQNNKEIYLAELQLEETRELARVLPEVKIEVPQNCYGRHYRRESGIRPIKY